VRAALLACAIALGGCKSEPPAHAPEPKEPPDSAEENPLLAPPPPKPTWALPDPTPAQTLALDQAQNALAADRNDEALAAFRRASVGPPSGVGVSAALAAAELLEAGDRLAEANAVYAELQRKAPAVPEVHLAAGRFFGRHGRDGPAIDALKRAVALQPDLLPAWSTLGVTLTRAGRDAEAGRALAAYEQRLDKLVRRLEDHSQPATVRVEVVDLFATLRDARTTTALIGALRDPHPHVRLAAAGALADDDDPKALRALARAALAETDPVSRRVMKEILGRARTRARQGP